MRSVKFAKEIHMFVWMINTAAYDSLTSEDFPTRVKWKLRNIQMNDWSFFADYWIIKVQVAVFDSRESQITSFRVFAVKTRLFVTAGKLKEFAKPKRHEWNLIGGTHVRLRCMTFEGNELRNSLCLDFVFTCMAEFANLIASALWRFCRFKSAYLTLKDIFNDNQFANFIADCLKWSLRVLICDAKQLHNLTMNAIDVWSIFPWDSFAFHALFNWSTCSLNSSRNSQAIIYTF